MGREGALCHRRMFHVPREPEERALSLSLSLSLSLPQCVFSTIVAFADASLCPPSLIAQQRARSTAKLTNAVTLPPPFVPDPCLLHHGRRRFSRPSLAEDVMEIAWVTILATIVNREDERR